MTNSSLLRCAAAFLVLSVYIWLFGITGVIEDFEPEETFADESLEFTPSVKDRLGDSNDALTASNIAVNPVNDPKPDLADFPVNPTLQNANGYSENISNSVNNINTVEDSPPSSTTTTPAASATTPATTTTPEPTTTPVTTTTPPTTTTATTTTPKSTTATPASITTPPPAEEDDYNSETIVNTSLAEKITVKTSNGDVTDSALNIVSRIVQHEIGSSFDEEAIKAMAVAAYTYTMFHIDQGVTARVELAHAASERVTDNVKAVLGQAVYYNGEYIQAVYHASSAGYTASAESVWGADFPYLRSVKCEFDKDDSNFGMTNTLSSTDIKIAILEKTGIQLSGSPENWIKILGHVDNDTYVGAITVGGHSSYTSNGDEIKFTGKTLRDILGTKTLRSAAFEFSYNSSTDKFTFITYGYGHGVGLSQNGANILARSKGYDYKQILEFYYPGTILK